MVASRRPRRSADHTTAASLSSSIPRPYRLPALPTSFTPTGRHAPEERLSAQQAGEHAHGHVREIGRSKLGRTMNPRTPWRREELALLESWSGTDAELAQQLGRSAQPRSADVHS